MGGGRGIEQVSKNDGVAQWPEQGYRETQVQFLPLHHAEMYFSKECPNHWAKDYLGTAFTCFYVSDNWTLFPVRRVRGQTSLQGLVFFNGGKRVWSRFWPHPLTYRTYNISLSWLPTYISVSQAWDKYNEITYRGARTWEFNLICKSRV